MKAVALLLLCAFITCAAIVYAVVMPSSGPAFQAAVPVQLMLTVNYKTKWTSIVWSNEPPDFNYTNQFYPCYTMVIGSTALVNYALWTPLAYVTNAPLSDSIVSIQIPLSGTYFLSQEDHYENWPGQPFPITTNGYGLWWVENPATVLREQ